VEGHKNHSKKKEGAVKTTAMTTRMEEEEEEEEEWGERVANLGVNYGTVARKLPEAEEVSKMLRRRTRMGSVRVYTSEVGILRAFAGSGLNVVAGVPDEDMAVLASGLPGAALWLATHIRPIYPSTNIVAIVVGNEILTSSSPSPSPSSPSSSSSSSSASSSSSDSAGYGFFEHLLDAMRNLWTALQWSGLGHIRVSTTHSMAVLASSYPPSSARFQPRLVPLMKRLLSFLADSDSPYMCNAYPYFAFKENPREIPLDYALFRPNDGVVDTATGLTYTNLFDAQVGQARTLLHRIESHMLDVPTYS
jgi:hypothetical protein